MVDILLAVYAISVIGAALFATMNIDGADKLLQTYSPGYRQSSPRAKVFANLLIGLMVSLIPIINTYFAFCVLMGVGAVVEDKAKSSKK